MNKLVLHIVLLFSWNPALTQVNLIPNGDFESYWDCPQAQSEYPLRCDNWYMASEGSSDYFNGCSDSQMNGCAPYCASAPQNVIGFQIPHSGNGYGGFIAYSGVLISNWKQYKEYFGLKLPEVLEAGEQYVLSFFINLGDSSLYATDKIGCHVSEDSLIILNEGPSFVTPLIANPYGILSDKENWVEIKDTFQAVGNERYITIGSFGAYADMSLTTLPVDATNIGNQMAYYFVDDVTLYKVQPEPESEPLPDPVISNINLPNILTPNNDQVNDFIDFQSLFPDLISIDICNRWGNLVHQGNKQSNFSWSGIDFKSGKICNDGLYFYSIRYLTNTGEKQARGFIELIR